MPNAVVGGNKNFRPMAPRSRVNSPGWRAKATRARQQLRPADRRKGRGGSARCPRRTPKARCGRDGRDERRVAEPAQHPTPQHSGNFNEAEMLRQRSQAARALADAESALGGGGYEDADGEDDDDDDDAWRLKTQSSKQTSGNEGGDKSTLKATKHDIVAAVRRLERALAEERCNAGERRSRSAVPLFASASSLSASSPNPRAPPGAHGKTTCSWQRGKRASRVPAPAAAPLEIDDSSDETTSSNIKNTKAAQQLKKCPRPPLAAGTRR